MYFIILFLYLVASATLCEDFVLLSVRLSVSSITSERIEIIEIGLQHHTYI